MHLAARGQRRLSAIITGAAVVPSLSALEAPGLGAADPSAIDLSAIEVPGTEALGTESAAEDAAGSAAEEAGSGAVGVSQCTAP